jgi:hypothetical protein
MGPDFMKLSSQIKIKAKSVERLSDEHMIYDTTLA